MATRDIRATAYFVRMEIGMNDHSLCNSQPRKAARILAVALLLAGGVALAAQLGKGEWSTVGGDSGNSRYSPLSQINTQNVAKLGAAWISEKIARLHDLAPCP